MSSKRASIFETDEAEIDVSSFVPKTGAAPPGPAADKVKAVSEAANFPSRDPRPAKPAAAGAKPKREPRRYRTGRNVQFNCKALQETIDRFYAITDQGNWVMGYTLARAVEALERELKKS